MLRPIVVPVHPRVLQFLAGMFCGAMAACVFTLQAHLIGIARGPSGLSLLQGLLLVIWALPLEPFFARVDSRMASIAALVAIAAALALPWALRTSVMMGGAATILFWGALRSTWGGLAVLQATRASSSPLSLGGAVAFALGLLLLPWRLLPLAGFFGGVTGLARLAALLGVVVLALGWVRSSLATQSTVAMPERDPVLTGLAIIAGIVIGGVSGGATYLLAGSAGRLVPATVSLAAWLPMAIALAALLALVPLMQRGTVAKIALVVSVALALLARLSLGSLRFGSNGRDVIVNGLRAMSVPMVAVAIAAMVVHAMRGARPLTATLATLAFAVGVIAAPSLDVLRPMLVPASTLPAGEASAQGLIERRDTKEGSVIRADGVLLPSEQGAEARAALAHVLHGFPQDILLVGETGAITEQTLRELGTYEKDQLLITPRITTVSLFGSGASVHERLHALTKQSFDLIVQQAVDPLRGEGEALLTVQHFELLKSLLHQADEKTGRRPGAVILWIGLDRLRWEGLGLVGRSFVSVFDNTTLWLADPLADVLTLGLFGRDQRLEANWAALDRYFRDHQKAKRLQELELGTPLELCGRYIGDEWFIRQHFDGADLNDDSHAKLEASEFWRTEAPGVPALNNAPLLLQYKENFIGRMLTPDLPRDEVSRIEQSLVRESVKVRDLAFAHQLLVRSRLLERLSPESRPRTGDKVEDPRELESRAIYQLSRLVKSFPEDQAPRREITGFLFALLAQGRFAEAEDVGKGGEQIATKDARMANAHGVALLALKRFDDAVAAFQRSLEHDAKFHEARANLGLAQAFANHRDDALRTLRDAQSLGELPPLAQVVLRFLDGDTSARAALLAYRSRPPFGELIDQLLAVQTSAGQ